MTGRWVRRSPPLDRAQPRGSQAKERRTSPPSTRRGPRQFNPRRVDRGRGEAPAKFVGNGACNTIFDSSAAPPDKHLAFWWPFAPYAFAEGGAEAWDQRRKEFTDRLLKEWQAYAPNLTKGNVLGTHLFTPLDIERSCINMVRGSYHGGVAYLPSQLGASRPTPELSQYRTLWSASTSAAPAATPGGPSLAAPATTAPTSSRTT